MKVLERTSGMIRLSFNEYEVMCELRSYDGDLDASLRLKVMCELPKEARIIFMRSMADVPNKSVVVLARYEVPACES